MIKEEECFVVTFDTGTDAFAAEEYCQTHNIPATLISMPGNLQAGCGLALKCPENAATTLLEEFNKAGLTYNKGQVMKVE